MGCQAAVKSWLGFQRSVTRASLLRPQWPLRDDALVPAEQGEVSDSRESCLPACQPLGGSAPPWKEKRGVFLTPGEMPVCVEVPVCVYTSSCKGAARLGADENVERGQGARKHLCCRASGPTWLLLSCILAVVAGESEWEEPGFPQWAVESLSRCRRATRPTSCRGTSPLGCNSRPSQTGPCTRSALPTGPPLVLTEYSPSSP